MNANELAEKIQFDVEPYIETDQFIFDECANMLRQQQAEIEVLNEMLTCEGCEASREYLDYHIAEILRKAQEK